MRITLPVVRVVFVEESYGVTEDSDSVSVCLRIEGEVAENFYINVTTADSHPVQAEGILFSKRSLLQELI